VKDKLSKMKTDLTSIIQKYELSSQGDGGVFEEKDPDDEEDDIEEQQAKIPDWGRSKGRTGAFDDRGSFITTILPIYFTFGKCKTDLFNTTMNHLSDGVGVLSPNEVPSIVLTSRMSSKADDSEDVSILFTSFRNVIVEVSKEANIAADRRHREKAEIEEERYNKTQKAMDKRVLLKNNLVNKGYLKRRIDTLQDKARSMRFKLFRSRQDNQKNEEEFFTAELQTIEDAIDKCQQELDD
jgi:hypothetical protein